MAARKITKITGNHVKIDLDDWRELWRILKASLPDVDARAAGGNGCEQFCKVVCEDHGGCDLEFGDPGDCGALCNDGEVLIQQ